MKKITLSMAIAMFITLSAQSQTSFPDGGFENCWEYFENPAKGDYWDFKENYLLSTLNQLYELSGSFGDAPLTAERLTGGDVYAGNYSLKLISNQMIFGDEVVFLPGVAGTLYIDIAAIDCELGEPFTSRPTAMKGWYKYEPVNGDSAAIEVFLQNDDIPLGGGKQIINNTVNTWTEFTIPISYDYEQTPNTIVILFVASAAYDFTSITTLLQCKGQVGSTLYLDDVEFVYETGIKEMLAPEISMHVYPNPSMEQITIQIGKETTGTIMVYDYLSRKVGEYPVNGTQTTINISDFATGSYLLNVIENNKVITTGRFLKQ